MIDGFNIKLDPKAFEFALELLIERFHLMRTFMQEHPNQAALERAIGAFLSASRLNETNKTQHT